MDARLAAFAMCMICSAEFPPDDTECPKCRVPLSLVRRCYSCARVVSAKHRRCIHCGLAFFPDALQEEFNQEDALDRIAAFRQQREAAKKRNNMRALSFSVAIFLVVLFLALYISHQFNASPEPTVLATSYVLRPAELRRAASGSSANIARLAGGEVIDITGYASKEEEARWFAAKWNGETAYIRADAVAPPKPKQATSGFEVLKFYIVGIEDLSMISEAAKAVAYYNQAFPSASTSGQELRWVLAEQARSLAARGTSKEQLLAEARAQYQILMDANGPFAEKARVAMNAPLPQARRSERQVREKPEPEVTVLGEQPDSQTVTGFGKNPAHEVTLLEHANIAVRLSRPGTVKDEGAFECLVAREVQSNGRMVIPAGAPCQVKIAKLQDNGATLRLAAVVVRNRSFGLRTSTAAIRNNPKSERMSEELSFRLEAPVAFTR